MNLAVISSYLQAVRPVGKRQHYFPILSNALFWGGSKLVLDHVIIYI